MTRNTQFEKELRFLKIIFWVGFGIGVFMLLLGGLGLSVGSLINLFSGDNVENSWALKLFIYGLIEAIFGFRIATLLGQSKPNTPQRITQWVG